MSTRAKIFVSAVVLALVAILWLFLGTTIDDGSIEDAQAAHERGDYVTALQLLRPLAEQHNVYAQLNLGFMYAQGQGVPQDDAEAVNWFRKSAERGHAMAQHNLGVMYANGLGVAKDYSQAYVRFNLVAAQFLAADVATRKMAARGRDHVASKMTPAQMEKAQRLSREWKPESQ